MDTVRTARATGAWYLALAVVGMLGFLIVRPKVVVDDPDLDLARIGLALELGIVITQAVAALWFYRLFAPINRSAAVGVLSYGLVNAAAILASASFLWAAITLDDPQFTPLLHELSSSAWAAGAIFFGLWLIPMGWAVVKSARMPVALGWVLVVGGFGYVASAFSTIFLPDAVLTEALSFPASIGEFWMIAYLLIWGIRPDSVASGKAATS
ncbi:DUF4386 domain-containing protein [Demequina sp.]|uniref:DUF4386 domain-containing protein n=1 Tax=Demequina sp. TaxID=2050685 RepID=UPI003D13903F